MNDAREELKEIVKWMNYKYNQDSPDYDFFKGTGHLVIRYNDHTAISTWECGAVVCIHDIVYFIMNDDGYWTMSDETDECGSGTYGSLPMFSVGWVSNIVEALSNLKDYVWKNGTPVYYSGFEKEIIAHYTLEENEK